jgi:predicted HicB family RNase H-like nuclease
MTMTDGKDAKLTIRISSELLDAAREKAQQEDITVSQYLRRCLMQWVGMLPPEGDQPTEKESSEEE